MQIRTYSKDAALTADRRDSIVRNSLKLLTKQGYHRTNMRELAEVCGMGIGTLYHYFGTKEDLLFLICERATKSPCQILENCMCELAESSPTETLIGLIKAFYKHHDETQDMTLFMYQETKNLSHEARGPIFESEKMITAIFEKVLQDGVESGEFEMVSVPLVANNIIFNAHAWAVRRWTLARLFTFESYLDEQIKLLFKAIKADQSTPSLGWLHRSGIAPVVKDRLGARG